MQVPLRSYNLLLPKNGTTLQGGRKQEAPLEHSSSWRDSPTCPGFPAQQDWNSPEGVMRKNLGSRELFNPIFILKRLFYWHETFIIIFTSFSSNPLTNPFPSSFQLATSKRWQRLSHLSADQTLKDQDTNPVNIATMLTPWHIVCVIS